MRALVQPLVDVLGRVNRKSAVILLAAPLLVATYRYLGDRAFYRQHLSAQVVVAGDVEMTSVLYTFAACVLLCGVVPAVIVRVFFGESLRDYGVQVGDLRFSVRVLLVMVPIVFAASSMAATMPAFRAEYPLFKGACRSLSMFAGYALAYLFYYLGWEFFFRGFMQRGLQQTFGTGNAILVQTLASCLAHIGKPGGEIYGSIIAGIVWGLVTARSRSLLAVVLVHWLLGVSLDALICYTGSSPF